MPIESKILRIRCLGLRFVLDPSYNQPKLSACATWNPDAITFADITMGITNPATVFVDSNNTVFVTTPSLNRFLVWSNGSNILIKSVSSGLNSPWGIFASINGIIYADNGESNHRIDRWSLNATSSVRVVNMTSRCFSLFLDTNESLYCSLDLEHRVIKVPLRSTLEGVINVAGNGSNGPEPNMLYHPNGIFVDIQFNLYVADAWNHRIQLFRSGQMNAETVLGMGSSLQLALDRPSAVVLDATNYLYITDLGNHRIIRLTPSGYQCLFGCTAGPGLASNQLNFPYTLSFDTYGHLFVADHGNHRIQKFLLATNSCGKQRT